MGSHSYRIKEKRWEKIEKKAWKFSNEMKKVIKPTDVADAIIWKYIDEITLEDVKNAIKSRKTED